MSGELTGCLVERRSLYPSRVGENGWVDDIGGVLGWCGHLESFLAEDCLIHRGVFISLFGRGMSCRGRVVSKTGKCVVVD